MQLNGLGSQTVTMAASEPPEPPPRNPEKINASLKQLSDTKNTKSLDQQSTTQTTSNKIFKSILSLDTQSMTTVAHQPSSATSSTSPKSSGSESYHHHDQLRGAASQLFSAATSTISNKINELVNGSGLVLVAGSEQTPPLGTTSTANNNKVSPTNHATNKPLTVENNNQTSPETAALTEEHVSGRVSVALDQQKALIFPNETASLYIERRENSNDSIGNGKAVGDELESPRTQEIRLENERLQAEIVQLKTMLRGQSPEGAVGGQNQNLSGLQISDSNSFGTPLIDENNVKVEKLENELRIAKELIQSLKSERKKLRDDKSDLLNQVKQLCISLQEKEKELRTFIRTFEQRIRDSESIAMKNNSDRERERWSLLKTARDEAERSLALAAQLNARDMQLQRTQDQLQEARRQLSEFTSDQESIVSMAPITPPPSTGIMTHMGGPNVGYTNLGSTPGDRGSCSADSGVRGSSDRESAAGDLQLSDGPCENGPCITVDSDSISLVSSHHNMYQYGTPKERSPTLSPLNAANFSRSVDSSALSRSVEQLGSPVDTEGPPVMRRTSNKIGSLTTRLTGRGGTWGSISRVFARSRRNKNQIVEQETTDFQWSPLTEEGYAEKLRLLREASNVPMERWRASQVLAWLEVALGMPQYSSRCTENVKSGKVLLELSDAELETGLGATHPMHRKKLRLAIEEHRRPDLVRYPTIGQLGHTWVASEWLPDIGLPQYAEPFLHSLVDARMLDTLSKKELEKYLGVTKKFHQASIVHAIHVLRIIKYDRQTLAVRRLQSENMDADPIVWTNQRFIRWARSIDLGEYADNLKDSGVHGGLVVLEPSFSGETMAMALGIPQSKSIIRRHLITEFEALVLPARSHLGQGIRTGSNQVIPITGPGGLQKTSGSLRYTTWKGSQTSLSRTFGFRTARSRSERTSTSPTPSYSSSEGGNYASIGQMIQHLPPPTTTPPPIPINNRISAPPITGHHSTLPRSNSQHRRVKSISDIESAAIAGNMAQEDGYQMASSPMVERQQEAIYREIQKKSLRVMNERE